MYKFNYKEVVTFLVVLITTSIINGQAKKTAFQTPIDTINREVPWTKKKFYNNPDNFQFALISDRTGAHREGVFGKGISKLNLIMPEFVISVGDMIEGGTTDQEHLDAEWSEFDSILNPLKMRYFFLPGNHDISNEFMAKDWKRRYGYDYYHFVYKNVLFLALNTNDDFVNISEAQIDYFKKALKDNKDVRWTFVVMHHPLWHYRELNGFDKIEQLLEGRDYSVFAGHRHRYIQEFRNEKNYMVLGTTGGGSKLRGPKMGEFDHVTWVTMEDAGPTVVNMTLDGLLEPTIASKENQDKITALSKSVNMQKIIFYGKDKSSGKVLFKVDNSGPDTLHFEGKIWHHHEVDFNANTITEKFVPNSVSTFTIDWHTTKEVAAEYGLSDIEIQYTMGYPTEALDLPFSLDGTQRVAFSEGSSGIISLSEPDEFVKNKMIEMTSTFPEFSLHYTTDGTAPSAASSLYSGPVEINTTTTVKACLVNKEGLQSATISKEYKKVPYIGAVKVKKSKGLHYKMYNGLFSSVKDFENMSPSKNGITKNLDVASIAAPAIDLFGLDFNGYIQIPKDGFYVFKLKSDDAGLLFIHDRLVADNDKKNPDRTALGYIPLKKGLHPVNIKYTERRGDEALEISYKRVEEEKFTPLDASMLWHKK